MKDIQIVCHYAGFQEAVQLILEDARNGWFKFTLLASQAGCRIQAPMVILEEHLKSFLIELEGLESKLELENKAIVLNNFTCQNQVVLGPLVPHEGMLFLDVNLTLSGPLVEENWGELHGDRLAGRYEKVRAEIADYPGKEIDPDNPQNKPLLSALKGVFDPKSIRARPNPEPRAGVQIRLAGMQFHRSQIPAIIKQLKALL